MRRRSIMPSRSPVHLADTRVCAASRFFDVAGGGVCCGVDGFDAAGFGADCAPGAALQARAATHASTPTSRIVVRRRRMIRRIGSYLVADTPDGRTRPDE